MLPIAFLMQSADDEAATAAAAGLGIGGMIFFVVVGLFMVATFWKLFEKARQPGWAALIPIYNVFVLLKIAGKPAWWFILFLIPFVNFVVLIMVAISLAERFGKGTGFGLGLAFLGIIFYPILAFGDARYQGPQAS